MAEFCSEASLGAGERQAGSAAAGVQRWLLLEWRRPWGPKAPLDSRMPESVQSRLAELAPKGGALRVQLLRHPDRVRGPLRVYLVASGRVWSQDVKLGEIEAWAAALDVDVDDEGSPRDVEAWKPESAPLYLVCTHGKRDACCAKRGLPLFAAFDELAPGRTWQSTHLGGHRFAPTFTALPAGTSYGRVPVDAVAGLVSAIDGGALGDIRFLRGRCDLQRDEQVAFGHLLEALGDEAAASPTALTLESRDGAVQRWRLGQRRFEVECALAEPLTLLASCSDSAPKTVERWSLRRLDETPAG